jgi:hypothetical protein
MISIGFIILFSYTNIRYIHYINPPSHFPYALLLSLVPIPRKDLVYLSALHFFKVYIDSPWKLHFGVSGMYRLLFNQMNPPYYLLCLFRPAPLLFTAYSALHYIIFIHRCHVFNIQMILEREESSHIPEIRKVPCSSY